MKTYIGTRHGAHGYVEVEDSERPGAVTPLDPRSDLLPHLPPAFAWGTLWPSTVRLAVALLADATGSDEVATGMGRAFARQMLAYISQQQWELTETQVVAWAETGRMDGHRLW